MDFDPTVTEMRRRVAFAKAKGMAKKIARIRQLSEEGMTVSAIAEKMGIAESSVRKHLTMSPTMSGPFWYFVCPKDGGTTIGWFEDSKTAERELNQHEQDCDGDHTIDFDPFLVQKSDTSTERR